MTRPLTYQINRSQAPHWKSEIVKEVEAAVEILKDCSKVWVKEWAGGVKSWQQVQCFNSWSEDVEVRRDEQRFLLWEDEKWKNWKQIKVIEEKTSSGVNKQTKKSDWKWTDKSITPGSIINNYIDFNWVNKDENKERKEVKIQHRWRSTEDLNYWSP